MSSIRTFFDWRYKDQIALRKKVILSEVSIADVEGPCDVCGGTGRCPECDSLGGFPHVCDCDFCERDTEDCEVCLATGKCPACNGAGIERAMANTRAWAEEWIERYAKEMGLPDAQGVVNEDVYQLLLFS